MNNSIKISIITVCFNSSATIEKTVKSVLNQTYKNIEYVIVDGGSSDSTLKILNKYKKKITKLISESDKGIYDAMNKGIDLSTGQFLYFLNSDDWLVDKFVISRVVQKINSNLNVDLFCGGVSYKRPEGTKVDYFQDFLESSLKKGKQPPHQGCFFNKKLFERIGCYNIKYKSSGDFEFFCRSFKNKASAINSGEKIAFFKVGGFSSKSDVSFRETSQIIKNYFGGFWYFYQILVVRSKNFSKFILIKLKLLRIFYSLRRIISRTN